MENKSTGKDIPRQDVPSQAEDPVNKSPKIEAEAEAVNTKESRSWRNHSNPLVRFVAKTGFTIWLIVMAVGVGLAFLVAFIAV